MRKLRAGHHGADRDVVGGVGCVRRAGRAVLRARRRRLGHGARRRRGRATGSRSRRCCSRRSTTPGSSTARDAARVGRSVKYRSDAQREERADRDLLAAGIRPGDPSLYPQQVDDVDPHRPARMSPTLARPRRHRHPARGVRRTSVPPPSVRRGLGLRGRRAAGAAGRDARTRSCTWRRSRCHPMSVTSRAAPSTASHADDVLVVLFEYDAAAADAAALRARAASRVASADDFSPGVCNAPIPGQAGCQFFFTEDGRAFCLYAVIGSYARARARRQGERRCSRPSRSTPRRRRRRRRRAPRAVDRHPADHRRRRRPRRTTTTAAARRHTGADPRRRRPMSVLAGPFAIVSGAPRPRGAFKAARPRRHRARAAAHSACRMLALLVRVGWRRRARRRRRRAPRRRTGVRGARRASSYLAFAAFVARRAAVGHADQLVRLLRQGRHATRARCTSSSTSLPQPSRGRRGRGRPGRAARRARRPAVARDPVRAPRRDRHLPRVPLVHGAAEDARRSTRSGSARMSVRRTGAAAPEPAGSRSPTGSSVARAALERGTSRRGFLIGSAMVGSAVAVAGVDYVTRPGTAYGAITGSCARGSAPTATPSSAARSTTVSTRARRTLRRRVVASRQFELLRRRHAVLHRLHAELLRSAVGLLPGRLLLLRVVCRVPVRGWLRHAPGVLQLLPLRAVPHGDRHVRTHRVPGRVVRPAVLGRRVTRASRHRQSTTRRPSTPPTARSTSNHPPSASRQCCPSSGGDRYSGGPGQVILMVRARRRRWRLRPRLHRPRRGSPSGSRSAVCIDVGDRRCRDGGTYGTSWRGGDNARLGQPSARQPERAVVRLALLGRRSSRIRSLTASDRSSFVLVRGTDDGCYATTFNGTSWTGVRRPRRQDRLRARGRVVPVGARRRRPRAWTACCTQPADR